MMYHGTAVVRGVESLPESCHNSIDDHPKHKNEEKAAEGFNAVRHLIGIIDRRSPCPALV